MSDTITIHIAQLEMDLSYVFGSVTPTRVAVVGSFADPETPIDTGAEKSDVDVCWTADTPKPSDSFYHDTIPVITSDGTLLGARDLDLFRPCEMGEPDVETFDDALDRFPEAIELDIGFGSNS